MRFTFTSLALVALATQQVVGSTWFGGQAGKQNILIVIRGINDFFITSKLAMSLRM